MSTVRNPNVSPADFERANTVADSLMHTPLHGGVHDVAVAAWRFAETVATSRLLDEHTLTCDEADTAYRLLRACGFVDAAARLIRSHTPDDTDEDARHYIPPAERHYARD